MRLTTFRILLAAASLYGSAATASTFAKKTYTYTPVIIPGSVSNTVSGINDSGAMLGGWYDANFTEHGYVFQSGTLTTFDDPDAVNGTIPAGINASGEIVGIYLDANYGAHGFTYVPSTGVFTSVDMPGANGTELLGIDSKGVAFGVASGVDNAQIVFSYAKGKFTTLPITGSPIVYGVNDKGSIAGANFAGSAPAAFVYVKGVATTLPLNAPGGSIAFAVNSKDVAVGETLSASDAGSGFVFAKGVATTVTVSGAATTALTDINDGGTAVGTGYDQNYTVLQGFVYSKGKQTAISDPAGTGTSALFINNAGQIAGTYTDATYGAIPYLATPN
jgi:hypothetical protein